MIPEPVMAASLSTRDNAELVSTGLQDITLQGDGVTLHAVTAGPTDGPLLLLLHGFPEFWYGWRKQIPYFARAGFRVVVPDQRGYNASDKPHGTRAYKLETLARDAARIIEQQPARRAFVVGHDWGGAVAFQLAADAPELVDRVALLNSAPATALVHTWFTHPQQLLRSAYIFWFQVPWLPERVFIADRCRRGRAMLRRSGAGAFSDHDLDLYCRAWQQPNAFTAQLNWYRSRRSLVESHAAAANARVHAPVLLLWGRGDEYLTWPVALAAAGACSDVRLIAFREASHWLHHEIPERVNAAIHEFLDAHSSTGRSVAVRAAG